MGKKGCLVCVLAMKISLVYHFLSLSCVCSYLSFLVSCVCVFACVCVQLFRSDLISAMKLPDSLPMESSLYFTIKETWRREWEFGVQVSIFLFSISFCILYI